MFVHLQKMIYIIEQECDTQLVDLFNSITQMLNNEKWNRQNTQISLSFLIINDWSRLPAR